MTITTNTIKQKVEEFVDNNISFTAYDITVSLRNDGERVAHNDVKTVVHDIFNNEEMGHSYERELKKIPGTQNTAFVYHHLMSDVDEYKPIKRNYKTNKNKSSTNTRDGVRNKQPVHGILDVAYPKYDGRLTIPRKLLKDAGIFNSKYYYIKQFDTEITISDSITLGVPCSPKSDGTVEIPSKYLKPLNKSTYKIELYDGVIYVS